MNNFGFKLNFIQLNIHNKLTFQTYLMSTYAFILISIQLRPHSFQVLFVNCKVYLKALYFNPSKLPFLLLYSFQIDPGPFYE